MKNKLLLVAILIFLLALFLRSWEFGKIPAGIYDDEASKAYNAYSLAMTGKDEYGKELPIFIRSFATYVPSLYTYTTILPVKILGLNEVSARLISLISGIVLVVLVTSNLGLVEGLIVALAPVFIFYSRAAFEPTLALTLLFAGIVLALKADKKPNLLIPSFLLISLSAYAYHTERFLSVIIIFYFSLYYWKHFKTSRRLIFYSLFIAIISQLPLLLVSLTSGANVRLSSLSPQGSIIDKIGSFIRLYFAYFSPNNLFSKPDPEPHRAFPELSTFYWWMVIPFIFGIYAVIKNRLWKDVKGRFIIFLTLISPIPGALTNEYFSTLRALPMFIGISWMIALGSKQFIRKWPIYIVFILLATIEIYSNLILLKHEKSSVWGYEYKQLSQVINSYPSSQVVVDTRLISNYILIAFHNKSDPQIIQSQYDNQWLNDYYDHTSFEDKRTLGNIEVRSVEWREDVYKRQLLVGDLLAISDGQAKEHRLDLLYNIPDINGQTVLRVFKTNPVEKCKDLDPRLLKTNEKCLKILKDQAFY